LRLLITGASGLLGSKLAELATAGNHEVYSAYNKNRPTHGKAIRLNICNADDVTEAFRKLDPEAVIHTAAFADVDKCEIKKKLAWKTNAEATKNIATSSASAKAHITYVSTDYVFNGEKGFYSEGDQTDPISYYGYTKLKSEEFVRKHAAKWCIARPSVLYGWTGHKQNFATWLIDNLTQERPIKVLNDQYVSPTLNTNLAEMLLEISEEGKLGILHTAGAARVSRFEYAVKLAKVFDLNIDLVEPARMSEMQWKAKRPRDSSLNVNKATATLLHKPMALDEALEVMAKEDRPSS